METGPRSVRFGIGVEKRSILDRCSSKLEPCSYYHTGPSNKVDPRQRAKTKLLLGCVYFIRGTWQKAKSITSWDPTGPTRTILCQNVALDHKITVDSHSPQVLININFKQMPCKRFKVRNVHQVGTCMNSRDKMVAQEIGDVVNVLCLENPRLGKCFICGYKYCMFSNSCFN